MSALLESTPTLTLPRTALLSALQAAERIVPAKSPLPVLAGLLLQADGDTLRVTANDLEVALTVEVGGMFMEPWTACVPAEKLTGYVASLNSAEVRLTLKGKLLEVRGGGSHANLPLFNADDFPAPPALKDGGWEVTLPVSALRAAITQTVYAAAADDSRPTLAGVSVRLEGSTLTLAAADGFRLAVRKVELADAVAEPVGVLVPATALRHLLRTLPTVEGVAVTLAGDPSGNRVVFRWDGGELVSRLIEGQFPDYQRIVPVGSTRRLELEAGDLLAASKTAMVLSKTNSNIVRLRADDDTLLVGGTDGDSGDSETRLTVTYEGEGEGVLAVNGKYLSEALSQILGTCEVLWTSPTTPMLIRGIGSDALLMVLMPMSMK